MRFQRFIYAGMLLAFGSNLALAATDDQAGQTYAIHMNRKVVVGQVYQIDATFSLREQINPPKAPQKVHLTLVRISGTDEILAVNQMGRETKGKITVDHFQSTIDGVVQPAILKGSVITLTREAQTSSATADGKPVDAGLAERLCEALNLDNPGANYGEQQVLGTQEPQSASGIWPINSKLAAHWFSRDGSLQPSDVTGQSQLASVSQINGEPFMTIVSKVKISKLPDRSNLPADVTIGTSHENTTITELFNALHQGPSIMREAEYDDVAILQKKSPTTGTMIYLDGNIQLKLTSHRTLATPTQ